jgi:hypothetical protein
MRRLLVLLLTVAGAASALACGPGFSVAQPAPVEESFAVPSSLGAYRYRVELRTNADLLDTTGAPAWIDLDTFELHIVIEGTRVNPDRERTLATVDLGYFRLERESVMVAGRYWQRQDTGPWTESAPLAEPEDFLGQDLALSPAIILAPDPEVAARVAAALEGMPSVLDHVNGYDARHWVLETAEVDRLFPAPEENPLPGIREPSAKRVELWVDIASGVVIRLVVTAASPKNAEAFRLQVDLFDLDDPSIGVEPPEVAPRF